MSTLRQILDGATRPSKKSRLLVTIPWREISIPPKPDNSVLEIFGEMEFRERNSQFCSPASTPLTPSPPPLLHYTPSLNLTQEIEETLEIQDLDSSDLEINDLDSSDLGESSCSMRMCLRCNSDSDSRVAGFPDPISTIGENGKPWLYYESIKKEGRFVLKGVRIPGQGCMHSTRENGRLLLQLRNPNVSNG